MTDPARANGSSLPDHVALRESDRPVVPSRAHPDSIRSLARVAAVLSLTAFCLLGVSIGVGLARDPRRRFARATWWTHVWGGLVRRACGIRLVVMGPPPSRGSLIAPNHTGYLDVFAVASAARCFFVPKADLGEWPVVRWTVGRSLQPLVRRSVSRALAEVVEQVTERLRAGESVCAFLEGTSTGGDRVLPFLPSLVQPSLASGRPIVPTGLRWSCSHPGAVVAEDVAYWREAHSLGPHLARVAGLQGVCCEIRFGEPVDPRDFPDRKALAAEVRRRVAELAAIPL